MEISSIDHINIAATGEKLLDVLCFYTGFLGLTMGYRPASKQEGYWLYAGDLPLVHITERDSESLPPQSPLDHIAFQASDSKHFTKRLDQFGIDYKKSKVRDLGLTQLFFRDPLGIGIELNFKN